MASHLGTQARWVHRVVAERTVQPLVEELIISELDRGGCVNGER